MKRRNFLLGVGGTAIGGSALLGTGAFTRVESQRRAKIQVAKDSDAYLGLDGCPDSANSSYTNIDRDGHLEIDMSPGNSTDAGGQGVNSDSHSYFDNVFQVCNNGKQKVGIWIDGFETPTPEGEHGFGDENDRAVDFYLDGDETDSIVGAENAFPLGVGQCVCVGLSTVTKGLSKEEKLIDSNEIVINADADNLGDLGDRVDPDSMSVTGMCSYEVEGEEYFLWRVYNENNFPVNTNWECTGHDISGALDVPANVTRGTGDEPWIPGYYFLTDEQCDPIILSANGTEVGRTGIDPDKECEEFERNIIKHLVESGDKSLLVRDGTLVLDETSRGLEFNDANREQERPHVNWSINGTQIKLEFVNPTNFTWAFDYRVDGEPGGVDDQWTGDEISGEPFDGEDYGQRYAGVALGPGETDTRILHVSENVELRLWRGPETDWYIPWITFNIE